MSLLISLLVFVLILSIAWWALSQLPLPQPVRSIVVVIIAIIAIVFLLQYLPGAGHSFRF
jgi:divalent metal cation (Fe/Co/Zn/Cd) transporter